MSRFQTVDLSAHNFHVGKVEFLRAEIPVDPSPFALIRYSVSGEEQPQGMRLDMDKMAFLDRPDSKEEQRALRKTASKIAVALREMLPAH